MGNTSRALISTVDITLDQTVTITESFYPGLSVTKLISSLGGSLGFWLGLGIIQLCQAALDTLAKWTGR